MNGVSRPSLVVVMHGLGVSAGCTCLRVMRHRLPSFEGVFTSAQRVFNGMVLAYIE